jgi:hypothetical protein
MNNVTVLFPGGFKPITGAHMHLANQYANNPAVSKVIMLIGPNTRDGVTREKSIDIFRLLNDNPKIEIQETPFPSPILAAYEYLFALPADTVGNYALAASNKDDDYVRVKGFISNVEKYKLVGDKKGRTIPAGVNAEEINAAVDPLKSNGQPISATTTRNAIQSGDYETFARQYPQYDDAIVKNVWQIFGQVTETIFSVDWWKRQLSEDIKEIMGGGYPTQKQTKHHGKKIKKLRSFLNKSAGDEFVYDFDKYDKTVFGVPISENYITRDELKSIEPVIDNFFRKYGIDVDFQGYSTHFINRLNDPRNEGTISLDDLENLFSDLAQAYGSEIVKQFQSKQPTAITSNLQFDVPLHMPFQLEFDRNTGQIKLIPRTIKSQRRPWKSNNPTDRVYMIESVITEGGLGGHMNHPYDRYDLTFNDMKEMIARGLTGRLDVEQSVTEKTDGQNIFVTYKNGQVGFARNGGERKTPLSADELADKFAGRGAISDAFREAGRDLDAALSKLGQERLNEIFKNGSVFANMEIIYPETRNIVAYETAVLQFHNLTEYDDAGNEVMTDMPGGAALQRAIQDANAHLQKTFQIIPPRELKLGQVDNFEDYQDALFNEVDQLRNRYGLAETDLVFEYHKAWWKELIEAKAQELGYDIPSQVLTALINRWSIADKSLNKTALKKMIDNDQFLNWVVATDEAANLKKIQYENIQPFESIFLKLGALILQNVSNFVAVNPSKAVQTIRKDLADSIRLLKSSNNIKDLQLLQKHLARIQALGGFDKIVPLEGIVFTYGGNTYKLTGSFAPINQLVGVLKYSR